MVQVSDFPVAIPAVEYGMAHFITRDALTKQQHERYWPKFCAVPCLDSRSGKFVVDPARFVTKIRDIYSVPVDPVLAERARGPDSLCWWPQWILDSPVLSAFLGRAVECTDDPEVFGARFVWVGVPFSGSIPTKQHVGHTQTPLTPCMVSLVTHVDPTNKRAYIWCVVNCDGDVVKLSNDVLEVLLASEIATLKSLSQRRVLMAGVAAASSKEGYVNAAKLICLRVKDVPGFETGSLLPFQDDAASSNADHPNANFMTPVKTTALPNRGQFLASADLSIARRVDSGGEVINPFLADPTPVKRAEFARFLQYLIHYGQYAPELKAILQNVPFDDDFSQISKDPAFIQYVRVHGDLTTHQ